MATFADWSEVYEPLVLPVGGKSYSLPQVPKREADRFAAAVSGSAATFSDDELEAMLLGPDLKQQMLDDGVPDAALKRILLTALAELQGGRVMAEMMWATGGDSDALEAYVKAHAPNRAARRTKTKS